jgi:PPIC-type PPIASE domain
VKRLIVLLLLLAGGLAAAAILVPTNAAVVNGTAISQGTLNSDVAAIAGSSEYQCYLNSQTALQGAQQALPPVTGAGKGQSGQKTSATTGFTATYLDTEVGHQIVYQVAGHRGVTVTSAELADARTAYENEITSVMTTVARQTQDAALTCGSPTGLTGESVLSTLPASFVDEQVQFFATSTALEEDLAGVGTSQADLRTYFEEHRSNFDTVCWDYAVYQSQSAANAAFQQAQHTPFSDVLKQAAQGGPGQCVPLPVLASNFSSINVSDLAVGTVSFPIAVANGDYLLLQLTSRTPSEYSKVKQYVEQAVQQKGSSKTQAAFTALERHSSITIDPRYGKWVEGVAQVSLPFSPRKSDVLNADANTVSGLASAISGSASG